jgi:hypothetical protein
MPSSGHQRYLEQLEARRRSLRDEVEDDVANLRGLTLELRGKIVESVCRDAMAILEARPDFKQAIQHQDPRSPESMATWLRLVKEHRSRGRD